MTSTIRLDLHVHSRWSPDSALPLRLIVERLGVVGLQGFALTDHNTIAGHRELLELSRSYPMYRFVPGIEVSTEEGHLLLYGVAELPPLRRPLLETLDWARDRGAVAVLAHPLRWTHGVGARRAREAPVAALETMNGHNSEISNARTALIAATRRIGDTGGSDAHSVADLGRTFTEFSDVADGVEAVLRELARGHTHAMGRAFPWSRRARLVVANGLRRAARGFRPI
ncbi:MAG TPA: CehA/McbA family metallohydrolase [Thermoplasmata archaeon]|nr:CehA/McbA family metallohydrolase [Thermoplasmata archaeon]